ncbi:hypothetical protein [Amycolatopsis sp. NPDC051061]|uniref:hypothetical protein n=1 Tax=Amycolatopsis sp. NPDC051061 TaxID=3155042 RepID=UPI0034474116
MHWIRGLLRSLAAEGRTVPISSHLISELQLTADHVLILGRGRLLSDSPMADLVCAAADTPLASLLTARGATVTAEPGNRLAVIALAPGDTAAIAAAHGISLLELTLRAPSLEDVVRRITAPELQYRTQDPREDAR